MANATPTDVDNLFVFVAACLVFFMHTGFAMLEAGGVQAKNRQAILIKNVMLVAISALSWWALGYLLSVGSDADSVFAGRSDGSLTVAFLKDAPKDGGTLINWFFGFAFAATSATIVSGAVAERVNFKAYLVYSAVVTSVVYPIVSYWGWASNGWLKNAGASSPDASTALDGYVDFAGSGIVHMVGGCAGLVGAVILGPRKFLDNGKSYDGKQFYVPRFDEDGTVNTAVASENAGVPLSALGTLILWLGWFGFNAGSAFKIHGSNGGTVGLCLVNTVLCPSAAAVTYFVFSYVRAHPDLGGILNSVLGGLVAITANCDCVQPWAAVLIGIVSMFVYMGSSYMLKMLKIDDVIDATPVHYFCGIWGLLATGLFASDDLTAHAPGLFYGGGKMLGWQVVGILVITGWTAVITAACLYPLKMLGWLRVSEEEEMMGLDALLVKKGVLPPTTPKSPKSKTVETNSALDLEENGGKPAVELAVGTQSAPRGGCCTGPGATGAGAPVPAPEGTTAYTAQ